jgi:hypothetical protein
MNEQEPEDLKQERPSHLMVEDYVSYKEITAKAAIAHASAEKAIAESKAVQSEAKYVILSLYFKYGLTPGKDEINDDGSLIYGEEPPDESPKDTNE